MPLIIALGSFQNFSKIRGDICKSSAPPVSMAPAANLPPAPPVSLIPAANLPPVSMISVAICRWYQRHRRQIWQMIGTLIRLLTPYSELEEKSHLYVDSILKGVPGRSLKPKNENLVTLAL
jgi:hypothetical protein